VGVVLAAFVILLGACSSDEVRAPAGIVRSPAPEVGAVALPDASGELFAMKAQQDELLLVYFGFTSCPDVCPTTLADLRRALRGLDGSADRVDVAMVTVDPGRDTAENLDAYVKAFFDRAHALRTDDENALAAAAEAFGAAYEVAENDAGEIEVSHTAFLYAVDSGGRVVLQWPFGTSSDDMRGDIEFLFEQGA
jgi:protein SCO1/2